MTYSAGFRLFSGLLATLCLLASGSAWAADDEVYAEDRIPSNVLLYVTSLDAAGAYEKFQNTSMGKLIQDPAMKPFIDQIHERIGEAKSELEEKWKISVNELINAFQGEVAFAVIRPVGQGIGWVAFLEYGDAKSTVDAVLERAQSELKKEGELSVETEDFEGTKVTTYTFTKKDEDQPTTVSISLLQKDGQLVLGSDSGVLSAVIDRWDGEHEDTFGNNKIYETIYNKCITDDDADPALIYYIDPIGLLANGLSMTPQTQNYAALVYMPPLGLASLKAIGGVTEFDTKDFDYVSRSLLYLDGPPTGVLKIFQLRSQTLNVPNWVPADASQYFTLDWDVKGAYEAIESIYDSFSGPGRFAMASSGLLQQVGLELKLKPDVIDVLSGKIQGYMQNSADESGIPRGVLSIGITDKAKGKKLLDAVWPLVGGAKSSDVSGATLYEPENDEQNVAMAVKDDAVLISSDAAQIQTALASNPKSPLTSSSEFKAVLKHIPPQVSLFSYQNANGQIAEAYEKARAGELDAIVEGKLDFSVLPPFEQISKYFTAKGGYYIPDEKGTLGVQFGQKIK